MNGKYIGRVAPSPTGYLHLGHARTFWVAYQRAVAARGRLLFRNDDLDRHRSQAEFVSAMVDDLRWLGIRWDGAIANQSERLPLYRAAFERLVAGGFVYECSCSRRDLARLAAAPHDEDENEPVYDGLCRERAIVRSAVNTWRFRVPDGEAISFVDVNLGVQRFVAGKDFGDFVVWSRDGIPSYQLANVVDDAAMGITEVVRGRDLLRSTARQILLQRALGLPAVGYFHCELMRDENGQRLAKRHDALSLRMLRERGMTPEEIVAGFGLEQA